LTADHIARLFAEAIELPAGAYPSGEWVGPLP
jgi:hypothetical protein